MSANPTAIWFTQMIEYQVPSLFQCELAQALMNSSEALALQCSGLQTISIQASEDGSRVLQYLQWESRQAWVGAAAYFVDESYVQMLQRYQARGAHFAAYQALRSLARGPHGALYCQMGEHDAQRG